MRLRADRPRLGLAIDQEHLRAVLVRGPRVAWALEASRDPTAPLAEQLGALLDAAPLRRWPRPAVHVVVDGGASQYKRLHGTPAIDDPELLERAVQGSAERFFLRNGSPLVVRVERLEEGVGWGAAFHAPVVEAIRSSCGRRRLTLGGIAAAAVLEARDDAVEPAALDAGDARRFALAWRAATADPPPRLALRAGARATAAATSRQRMQVAALLCAMLTVLAWLAPALRAARIERRATARLASLAPERRTAVALEENLRLVSEALDDAGAFASRRVAMTPLLASVTRALPRSAALTAFTVDSSAGVLVVLAPRAAAVVAALDRVPGLIGPELVGPVTPETVHDAPFERATIRFRLGGTRSAGAAATGGGR